MASSGRKVRNIHKDMGPGRSVGGPTQRSTWAAQIRCYGLLKKKKGEEGGREKRRSVEVRVHGRREGPEWEANEIKIHCVNSQRIDKIFLKRQIVVY